MNCKIRSNINKIDCRRNNFEGIRIGKLIKKRQKSGSVLAVKCIGSSFNLLKPSGFFTFHQVSHSKILHGARFALSVLYGYQNRQRLLLYTSLTD